MTDEKKQILDKINRQIHKLRNEMLNRLPTIHEVNDGIIIRFFTDWNNCDDNNKIRYKRIVNLNKSDEKVIFFFIPKGTIFERKKRDYIGSIICINGNLELEIGDKTMFLEGYTKICLEDNEFYGKALENTYLITTNKA
jgi:hypothetical protein